MTFQLSPYANANLAGLEEARRRLGTPQKIRGDEAVVEAVLTGFLTGHLEFVASQIGPEAAGRALQQAAADTRVAMQSRREALRRPGWPFWLHGCVCGAAAALILWWPA